MGKEILRFAQYDMGNNRLVTDTTGAVLQTNHFDSYGQSLPAGAAADSGNPYKFGGKEYDAKATSYDFGARYYTTSIPQWTTMDPLCEKYYSISPYAYCAGNPVNLVDPEGCSFTDYYSLYGKLLCHVEDGKNDCFFVIGGGSISDAEEQERLFPVPSPKVLDTMELIQKQTNKKGKEYGFRVGENGGVSIVVEGNENCITTQQWQPAIDDLYKNQETMVLYDVHTHPKNQEGSTNRPSKDDKKHHVGHAPNVILGYELLFGQLMNSLVLLPFIRLK